MANLTSGTSSHPTAQTNAGVAGTPTDLTGPAAAAALTIAHTIYDRLAPLAMPPHAKPDEIARLLVVHGRSVGSLAWEILHGLNTPRRP